MGGFLGGIGGAGGPWGGIIGGIVGALGDLFGGASIGVGTLAQGITATWGNLLSGFGFVGSVLSDLKDLIAGAIKAIGQALEHLVRDLIYGHLKAIIEAILHWISNLRNWIKVHLAALQQIQRNLDRARSQYFRRIIDIVQRIRRILVPFRLLHLGFARKLDQALVGIESDIGRKWARMIQHQNQVLGVLNDIIDPRNLLRPGNTLGSIGAAIGAIHGAIGALDVRDLLCLSLGPVASPLVAPWATTRVVIFQEWRARSGDYAVYKAQHDDTLRALANDLGVTTIV